MHCTGARWPGMSHGSKPDPSTDLASPCDAEAFFHKHTPYLCAQTSETLPREILRARRTTKSP
eukprot:7632351-Pyramimonas_sp.AAC.1